MVLEVVYWLHSLMLAGHKL